MLQRENSDSSVDPSGRRRERRWFPGRRGGVLLVPARGARYQDTQSRRHCSTSRSMRVYRRFVRHDQRSAVEAIRP